MPDISNCIEVSNAAGLDAWAEIARDNPDASCILLADITYDTNKEWKPIGTFAKPYTGTFDGNGKTISNISINAADCGGLFGYIGNNGTVKDLNVKDINITGGNSAAYVGVIAGCNDGGTIAGCTVETAKITADDGVIGGIVGQNLNDSTMMACSFQGNINSDWITGGVVGQNYGTVISCWASCVFEDTFSGDVGGVAGHNYNSIVACYWKSDAVSDGVGDYLGSDYETTQIGEDGSWADAVTAMNGKLQDWKWKYATNEYPTIVRVSI